MLILRLSRRWWSFPLIGEDGDDGIRWRRSSQCPSPGCLALGAERRQMEWNRMECLVIESGSPSSKVRPYLLYNEIGRVRGSLEVLVYGLRVSESRRVLQRCIVDHRGVLELKKPGHHPTTLF
jgi:hypothetical protein